MPITNEKATIQASPSGPARYSGGVPMPDTPSPGLTPEEGSVESASKAARETVRLAKAKLSSTTKPGSSNRLNATVKKCASPHAQESPKLHAAKRPVAQSSKSGSPSESPNLGAVRKPASQRSATTPHDSPNLNAAARPDQLTDKMKGRAHAVAVKTRIRVAVGRQSATDGLKLKTKADACDMMWFKTCFPEKEREEVKAAYPCTYVDGRSAELHGRLVITNIGLHFGQGTKKKSQTRESVMFKKIAGMEVVHPAQLNVYTIDNKLLRFKEFEAKKLALAAAHDDVDLCWRCYGEVPNPAAIYYSS
ncbi:hypothetical protein DIPPA_02750 [Diplonema papillatum]|nr:hypothetical protein DIPPA_02750 [Diplonema papillatum]